MRGATEQSYGSPENNFNFYSRTPCEVRRHQLTPHQHSTSISTHAPLARCDRRIALYALDYHTISTHAPLARCDNRPALFRYSDLIISTHAPLARCDEIAKVLFLCENIFLLTHPLRGATTISGELLANSGNFYSRTPCEVRQYLNDARKVIIRFLLTHPLRGAT